METIKYNSMNHGLICSWNKFKLLEIDEVWDIYSNLLKNYSISHLKTTRKSEVIAIKHAFFNILCLNKHKVIDVAKMFHVDHSTIINGRDKVKGYIQNKDKISLHWYSVAMNELKKYGYKDYSNLANEAA